MTHATALGLDIGFGNLKAVFALGSEVKRVMFPALVAPVSKSAALSTGIEGTQRQAQVVQVNVNGRDYEVGPGVIVGITASARPQTDDFPVTDQYAALLAGAFKLANISSVDHLVLGLPMHTMDRFRLPLAEKFTGHLHFGEFDLHVKQVTVMPQPIGSLMSARQSKVIVPGKNHSTLVIDVGYYTTDWIVTNGMGVDKTRSSGMPGGASSVYREIADMLGAETKQPVTGIERIDRALRDHEELVLWGKKFNLARDYLPAALKVIDPVTMQIRTKLGHAEDIYEIWLAGGGAALYVDAVKHAFPGTSIDIVPNPCYANAEGFYIAGLAASRRLSA